MSKDYVEFNIQTGETIVREHTQAEKDAMANALSKRTDEMKWRRIRQDRNQLLKDTDYAALPDSPEMTSEMATYRQALRDLPASKSNPDEIVFPDKP